MMARAPTYYEILGIRPDASPEELREAYLRLMKRHHPDRQATADDANQAHVAPLLNRCYELLRDPRSRAAYDAQLSGWTGTAIPSRPVARPGIAYQSRIRQRQRLWLIAVALIATIAIAELLAGLKGAGWLQPAGDIGPSAAVTAGTIAPPMASETDILRTTRRAISASHGEAVMISSNCFARLRNNRSRRAEDLCVVFDNAYIYWRRASRSERALPSYFDEPVVRIRHLNAISGSDTDPDARLPALRDVTFRALLAQVRAQEPVKNEAASTRGAQESPVSHIGTRE
jgi:hypothetical protein